MALGLGREEIAMDLFRRLRRGKTSQQVKKGRVLRLESLERRAVMSAAPLLDAPMAQPQASVAAHYIFYNQSVWDLNNPAIDPAKDNLAIAPGKTPYLPGAGLATVDNITNFSRGITGIMVDLTPGANHTGITASDFVFKVGNNNSPDTWATAPAPAAISVIPGGGAGGSDRVEITWASGAIKNQWLQVRVKASANTGLTTDDVFYWGNKIGSASSNVSPTATTFATTSTDAAQVMASIGGGKSIADFRDFNRDGNVSSTDAAIVMANIGAIPRLNVPAPTTAYGLTGPVGPQTGVNAPAGAIILSASSGTTANQRAIDNAPAGSVIYFTAGTYTNLSIQVKAGSTYLGAFGAILTSTTKERAFSGSGTAAKPVTVANLIVDGYVPPSQQAAILGGDYFQIDRVEVRNSATGGVQVGSHSKITNSYIHDNGQLGIEAYSTDNACTDVLVENTRVSRNNPANAFDVISVAGGSKFWNVSNLTIRHCEFDNNVGDGIWMDGNLEGGGNSNVTIEANWTHDNGRYGIFQEIGGSAVITGNLVESNGLSGLRLDNGDLVEGAGIQIDNSEGITITGNIVRNNYHGVVLQSYTRSDTTHRLRNISVTNNTITMARGTSGVREVTSLISGIVFDNNTYELSGSAAFVWGYNWGIAFSAWQALGFDAHSTIVRR
jgi:parallel beta-helix repeat protein